MNSEQKKIVVIGGGTGSATVLSGLKNYDVMLTALMAMTDDGGSNGILRREFNLLPTAGIWQAMTVLSTQEPLLIELFRYRYHEGEGISGMTFGNLIFAALSDILGSQDRAISEIARMLAVKGEVIPISHDMAQLVAVYEDGSVVIGEHNIDQPSHDGTLRIKRTMTKPNAKLNPEARGAILQADVVILGPGDFYTNTVADLVIEGVVEALLECDALVVFIVNILTKLGETYGYSVSDFLKDLDIYLPLSRINALIINSDTDISLDDLEGVSVVNDDIRNDALPENIKIIRDALVSKEKVEGQRGDPIKRNKIRHDSAKIGNLLWRLLNEKTSSLD